MAGAAEQLNPANLRPYGLSGLEPLNNFAWPEEYRRRALAEAPAKLRAVKEEPAIPHQVRGTLLILVLTVVAVVAAVFLVMEREIGFYPEPFYAISVLCLVHASKLHRYLPPTTPERVVRLYHQARWQSNYALMDKLRASSDRDSYARTIPGGSPAQMPFQTPAQIRDYWQALETAKLVSRTPMITGLRTAHVSSHLTAVDFAYSSSASPWRRLLFTSVLICLAVSSFGLDGSITYRPIELIIWTALVTALV